MNDARQHHEKTSQRIDVLAQLRCGPVLKQRWESQNRGSRIAPAIDKLKNSHGFSISKEEKGPTAYFLDDGATATPSLIEVNDHLKLLYWSSDHWRTIAKERRDLDGGRCVVCHGADELRCHHLTYARLFCESITDLITVCDPCHGTIHGDSDPDGRGCRLKFPSGISIGDAHDLNPALDFPDWTRP